MLVSQIYDHPQAKVGMTGSGYSKAEVGTRERKWISCLNVGTLVVK